MNYEPDTIREEAVRRHLVKKVMRLTQEERGRAPAGGRLRTPLVTAIVGSLVVGTTVVLLLPGVSPAAKPAGPTSNFHSTPLSDEIPRVAGSKVAYTWTNEQPDGEGDLVDLHGKTLTLAAVCRGGGSIKVVVTGRNPLILSCDDLGKAGPITLTGEKGSPASGSIAIDVSTQAGAPEYLVATAVKPAATD